MAAEDSYAGIDLEPIAQSSVPTLDVEDVTHLEHEIAAHGTPMAQLMDRAGKAVAKCAMTKLSGVNAPADGDAPLRVCVVTGSGNNGGDGWVCARELLNHGYAVDVLALRPPATINAQPAHMTALQVVRDCRSHQPFHVDVAPDASTLAERLSQADICIDALLGTGFSGLEVRKPLGSWIDAINAAHDDGCKVVAVDVPSGLNVNNGMPAQPCVQADATVVMMVKKTGLRVKFGRAKCGDIYIANIADLAPYREFLNHVRIDY